jgi:hypothetical protein
MPKPWYDTSRLLNKLDILSLFSSNSLGDQTFEESGIVEVLNKSIDHLTGQASIFSFLGDQSLEN